MSKKKNAQEKVFEGEEGAKTGRKKNNGEEGDHRLECSRGHEAGRGLKSL